MTTGNDKKTRRLLSGDRIKKERIKKRLTREELAGRADISPRFLADIEAGNKGMSTDTLCNLCAELDVSLDYIMNGIKWDAAMRDSQIKDIHEKVDKLFEGLDKRGFHFLEEIIQYEQEERYDEGGPDGPDKKDRYE